MTFNMLADSAHPVLPRTVRLDNVSETPMRAHATGRASILQDHTRRDRENGPGSRTVARLSYMI